VGEELFILRQMKYAIEFDMTTLNSSSAKNNPHCGTCRKPEMTRGLITIMDHQEFTLKLIHVRIVESKGSLDRVHHSRYK
jgi:hypothetical protein